MKEFFGWELFFKIGKCKKSSDNRQYHFCNFYKQKQFLLSNIIATYLFIYSLLYIYQSEQMRGGKFTNRIYFSKDGNKLIINQDPLPIQLANKNLILKGKMIRRKKTYKTPLQSNRVYSLSSINTSPVKPKQDLLLGSGSIKKDNLKIESKTYTYDILAYLKMRCSNPSFKTPNNNLFNLEKDQMHSQSGKIGVALRRMQTSESKPRFSNSNIENKSTDFTTAEGSTSNELTQSAVLSKSQSPIKLKTGWKTHPNPINLIKIPKLELKNKLLTDSPLKLSNKNRPLLSLSLMELKHIKSESYAMIEADSEQLVLTNKGKQGFEIASLTKVMTAYLIIAMAAKRNIDLKTEMIEVEDYVEKVAGTSAELMQGDIYSAQQLLYGLLLPSGNDAALVLADWGGSILNTQNGKASQYKQNVAVFVQEMTRTARQLGLKDTKYGNPHGLPHSQGKSTALDQCRLALICLKIPVFREIVKTKKCEFQIKDSEGGRRVVCWQNTNKLLRREGFIGLKTGITVTAGPCLVSAYQFKQKVYILTVLRASKVSRRFKDTRKILFWALNKLYQGKMCFEENLQLEELNRDKQQLDSDNSEDENEFVYGEEGGSELTRRIKILTYQL